MQIPFADIAYLLPLVRLWVLQSSWQFAVGYVTCTAFTPWGNMIGIHVSKCPYFLFVGIMTQGAQQIAIGIGFGIGIAFEKDRHIAPFDSEGDPECWLLCRIKMRL